MSTHTKGPLYVKKVTGRYEVRQDDGRGFNVIALVPHEQNAILFAAAPDMFQEIRASEIDLEELRQLTNDIDDEACRKALQHLIEGRLNGARSILTKATGGAR